MHGSANHTSNILVAGTVVGFYFLFLIKFSTAGRIYNVVDYQAVGDGTIDDSQAFMKAWSAACSDAIPATLLVPPGKKFLIGTATSLQGPCNSPVNFQIDGNITAPNRIWTTERITWISFNNINNLNVYGQGTIDGQGAIWWDYFVHYSYVCSSQLIDFDGCNNLALSNITLMNGPRRHLAFHQCTHLTVKGITITAPGDSPNTDGINIADSQNINITGSTFAIGDDCIAISSGTSNVSISNMTCGPSHGISIGSLGRGGTVAEVEQIHVFNSNIFHSMTGVRIKTWQGGSGYVKDVTFERINITQVATPIVINQFYTDYSSPASKEDAVAISNVKFMNIQGTSTKKTAVCIQCSAAVPCTNLTFDTVTLARDEGDNRTVSATIENAYGMSEGITIPHISLSKKIA
ncbi:Polygalacturonase [Carex littledalei]|uniref:Polygalacturonase n=1 Tax=Carex littledalei TaxID=544730 RepID=A0A833R1K5_9POAL|nr:Polygalacturonase [Carex littledalei]